MQFPWHSYPARLPPPVQQFYRFPRPLPEFEEDLEAASRTGLPCHEEPVRGRYLEPEFYCPLRLDSSRQHHLHRETDSPRFRSCPPDAKHQGWFRKAHNLSRETSTGTRPGYRAVLQMEAGRSEERRVGKECRSR